MGGGVGPLAGVDLHVLQDGVQPRPVVRGDVAGAGEHEVPRALRRPAGRDEVGVQLVDARTQDAFATGTLPGAVNMIDEEEMMFYLTIIQ